MAEPDWNPDTAGRPLAEILREAGIDTSRAARRRRWDDPDDTGIRQRRPDAPDDPAQAGYGRRSSDSGTGRGGREPDATGRSARVSDTGRSGRVSETGRGARVSDTGRGSRVSDTGRGARVSDTGRGARVSDTGRGARVSETGRGARVSETGRSARAPGAGRPAPLAADPSTAAIPGLRPSGKPDVPGAVAAAARDRRGSERGPRSGPQRAAHPDAREGGHFSTGPIPVVREDAVVDAEESTPRESALAWLRFAGELVIALAAGIGVYFLATVLWEQVPQLAVFLVPLAVTGLVAGVSAWRQRLGREPLGTRLIAVLVFAGALLTVAPAAGLLAGG